MSPRDRALWLRLQRRAASLSPSLRDELLDAYRVLRESLSDAELARLIAEGRVDAILDDALLDRSLIPLRDKLKAAVQRGFQSTIADLPRQGKINGQTAVAFDTLNPRIIDAVRSLDSRVVNTLKEDVRETVRAYVENGLRDGTAPRTVARQLRSVIGLSPTQAENAIKYEAKLRALVRKPLTEAQITRRVEKYTARAIRLNADTNARTATLDSLKLGQKLSWDDAIAQGVVDPSRLTKTWVTVGDDRVRDEHVAMQGETVPYANAFSNGEYIPGESTFNCRCIARYSVARAA